MRFFLLLLRPLRPRPADKDGILRCRLGDSLSSPSLAPLVTPLQEQGRAPGIAQRLEALRRQHSGIQGVMDRVLDRIRISAGQLQHLLGQGERERFRTDTVLGVTL
jgi:hypothetical protein